jgi:hypothetical protein
MLPQKIQTMPLPISQLRPKNRLSLGLAPAQATRDLLL